MDAHKDVPGASVPAHALAQPRLRPLASLLSSLAVATRANDVFRA